MNRNHVLSAGAQMRQNILSVYACYPPHDAHEITRRMLFEIGEAISDLQGRKDAGLLLYAAADAVTAKLPIEDFRLPSMRPAMATAAAAPTIPWSKAPWALRFWRVVGKILHFVTDRFWIGFVLGLIARGQP